MPLRPCSTCHRPVPNGRCSAHPSAAYRYRPDKPRGPYNSAEYKRNRPIVLEASGGLCALCGGAASTVDHIIPWSRGGGSGLDNLQALCRPCNSRKKDL